MPMLTALYRIAHDEAQPPAVRLAAIRDWLDRAGIKEAFSVEVTVQPWERLVDGIVSEVEDEQLARVSRIISGEVVDTDDDDLPDLPPSPTPTATTQPPIPSRRRRGSSLARR
jgi:hypothetical protein